MNRDQALAKIKKCLALGKSAEPHEAASAMRQAQKLMEAFEVTERELSMIDVHEVRIKATSTAANVWELRLVHLVAQAFGCEFFAQITGGYSSSGIYVRQRFYVFVGLESAPTIAGYAYEVLSRQCAKARLAHVRKQPSRCKPITKTARGDEFAKGWVVAVFDLVNTFANPARNQALVLSYIDAKHPEMKTLKPRDSTKGRKLDYGHQLAGFNAGAAAQLDRGLGTQSPQGLLTL